MIRRRAQLLLTSSILAAACGAIERSSSFIDDGALMPTFRASVAFDDEAAGEGGAGDGASPARHRSGFELEVTRADGEPSPTADYELLSVQALAQLPIGEPSRWHWVALLGLEYIDFAAEERSAPASASFGGGAIGLAVGLDAGVQLLPRLEAYGRGTWSPMLLETVSSRAELGLRLQVARHAELFAGYRWWHFEHEEDFGLLFGGLVDVGLDVEIRTEGLFFGMALPF